MRDTIESEVELMLDSLRGATADLARSANVAVSRMVLRSQLSSAIAHAGKAQHAAEVLQAAALTEIMENENASFGQDRCVCPGSGPVTDKLLSEEKGQQPTKRHAAEQHGPI